MKNINNIVENQLCSGCGGCSIICPKNCITIEQNINNIANIDMDLCINCGLCQKVCPAEYNKNLMLSNNEIDFLGNVTSCFVGNTSDKDLRYRAASGGIVTETVKYLLANKVVDGAIMIKGSEVDILKNEAVIINSLKELENTPGSRYSPASACIGLEKIDFSKKYIFVGKPCEVKAVDSIRTLRKKYKESIIFTISIMCFQTPSLQGTLEICKKYNINLNEIKELKYRGNGWPGSFICKTDTKNVEIPYLEAWNNYISKHGNIGCKTCVDPFGKSADLLVGDPWHSDYDDEVIGKSACIVRSSFAQQIIDNMKNKSVIELKQVDINYINSCQKQLLKKIDENQYIRHALEINISSRIPLKKVINCYGINIKKYAVLIKKTLLYYKMKKG